MVRLVPKEVAAHPLGALGAGGAMSYLQVGSPGVSRPLSLLPCVEKVKVVGGAEVGGHSRMRLSMVPLAPQLA